MLHLIPHISMWGELQHAHLGSIFSLIKQLSVSWKMSLSSAANGLPNEIKKEFQVFNTLDTTGFWIKTVTTRPVSSTLFDNEKKLTALGFSVNRSVSDSKKNTYGNRLISLHHRFGLYIVKGCVGKCENSILRHLAKPKNNININFALSLHYIHHEHKT